jgi:hypothetical protein
VILIRYFPVACVACYRISIVIPSHCEHIRLQSVSTPRSNKTRCVIPNRVRNLNRLLRRFAPLNDGGDSLFICRYTAACCMVILPFHKIFSANNSTRIFIYFIIFTQTEIFLDSSSIKWDNYSHKSETKSFRRAVT